MICMDVSHNQKDPEYYKTHLYRYFCTQPDVIIAYLFGSVARGQATERSDVDIAVLFVPERTGIDAIERQIQITYDLEDCLMLDEQEPQAKRPEVQITVLNRATPLLAYQVVKDGILLYERGQEERVDFEVRAMKLYFDIKPWLEFQHKALIKRTQEGNFGKVQRRNRDAIEAARRLSARLARVAAS